MERRPNVILYAWKCVHLRWNTLILIAFCEHEPTLDVSIEKDFSSFHRKHTHSHAHTHTLRCFYFTVSFHTFIKISVHLFTSLNISSLFSANDMNSIDAPRFKGLFVTRIEIWNNYMHLKRFFSNRFSFICHFLQGTSKSTHIKYQIYSFIERKYQN